MSENIGGGLPGGPNKPGWDEPEYTWPQLIGAARGAAALSQEIDSLKSRVAALEREQEDSQDCCEDSCNCSMSEKGHTFSYKCNDCEYKKLHDDLVERIIGK